LKNNKVPYARWIPFIHIGVWILVN
jgi:hypothetical protein